MLHFQSEHLISITKACNVAPFKSIVPGNNGPPPLNGFDLYPYDKAGATTPFIFSAIL